MSKRYRNPATGEVITLEEIEDEEIASRPAKKAATRFVATRRLPGRPGRRHAKKVGGACLAPERSGIYGILSARCFR